MNIGRQACNNGSVETVFVNREYLAEPSVAMGRKAGSIIYAENSLWLTLQMGSHDFGKAESLCFT